MRDEGTPTEPVIDESGPRPLVDLTVTDEMAWAMVDAAPDALVMVNEDGTIELVNHQSEVLFGYDRGELLGRPVEVLLSEELTDVHRGHRTRYRVAPEARAMGGGMDLWARRADGSEIAVEISLSPLTLGGQLRVIAAVRDISARKAAEGSAQQIRRGIDSIADGVYLVDPATMGFVYVNHGATVQTGFSAEELLDGMTPLHFAAEFTSDQLDALFEQLIQRTSEQLHFETVLRPRSGIDFPVDVVIEYPELGKGQQRLFVLVVRDISARVAVEEHARLIQHSVDSVSDAVFMCDEHSLAFTYVNQGAVELHGFSKEELLGGMTPADLAPDLPPEKMQAVLERLATAPGDSARLRTEGRRKEGTKVPVEVQINWPPPGRHGGPRPLMAVVRDISEQVSAEEAMRVSQARFRAAFDEGPVPMTLIEVRPPEDRIMIDVNDALCELFGYTRDELIGRPASDLIHADNVLPDTSIASAVASGRTVDYEQLIRGVRSDGTEIWLHRHASALDPDGEQNKLIVHVVDVTADIEAEIALRRREAVTAALSSVRLSMLRGESRADGLALICASATELLDATGAAVLTPTDNDDELAIEASAGIPAGVRARMAFRSTVGPVGEVFQSGTCQFLTGGDHERAAALNREVLVEQHVGPILLAPLPSGEEVVGILAIIRLAGGALFTDADLDPIGQFAAGAVSAIELAAARETEATLELLEDRERMGRDLHDNVIGRLFATGMSLQAAAVRVGDRELEQRLNEAVTEIDHAIKDIRTAIYGVRSRIDWGKGVRGEILAIAADHSVALGFEPNVRLNGPIDDLPQPVVEGLLATVREALTNTAKYADASTVTVDVAAGAVLEIEIVDDGVGFDPDIVATGREFGGNGLNNMTVRAHALGGSATVSSQPGSGTAVAWVIPLD